MLAAIEHLLKNAIGLDSHTVGLSVIRHALRERMVATGLDELNDYWGLVTRSRAELQELINAVIVPETWFFRDRDAFRGMTEYARAHLAARRPLRILSLPCSTGEEAYTIAMAMLDAGYGADDFSIEARDVSSHNLELAQTAIYGRNSFRGSDIAFRDRYFEAVEGGGYRPSAAVRGRVHFRLANLLDPPEAAELGAYDIVFCRNLLIYFDRATQHRALERLEQLLAPDGLLLVGPAESALPIAHGLVSARLPMAFAFLRAPKTKSSPPRCARTPSTPPAPRAMRTLRPATFARPVVAPGRPAASRPPQPKEVVAPDPRAASLAAIEQAANLGRLAEAREAALAHLAQFGPSASVFYHLALVQDADGNPVEAVRNYRKAIYLAPDHREALAQLALLLLRQGDSAGARALNNRLGRMADRSGS